MIRGGEKMEEKMEFVSGRTLKNIIRSLGYFSGQRKAIREIL